MKITIDNLTAEEIVQRDQFQCIRVPFRAIFDKNASVKINIKFLEGLVDSLSNEDQLTVRATKALMDEMERNKNKPKISAEEVIALMDKLQNEGKLEEWANQ